MIQYFLPLPQWVIASALRCRHPQVKNLCGPVIRPHSEMLMKTVDS